MPHFTITGEDDPFLHVSLQKGEKICCESNAMVMMEESLDLKGRMTGGLGSALLRRFANGESFFQQHIEAVRGDGDCLLSPTLPGGMQVLDVGRTQYTLSDGAFVASSDGVELKVKMQGIGGALLGDTGGFMVMESTGQGQLVVSGFGSLFELEVTPGKDLLIDNGHVVCWDSAVQYKLSTSTNQSAGLLGNLVNSVTSGEGIVLRFSGRGKVVVCSRNRQGFVDWLGSKVRGR